MLYREKHEELLKSAAMTFRLPDSTKVRKVGPARKNAIGETFGQSHVLNCQKRIEDLMKWKEGADADKKLRAEKKQKLEQEKRVKVAEKK